MLAAKFVQLLTKTNRQTALSGLWPSEHASHVFQLPIAHCIRRVRALMGRGMRGRAARAPLAATIIDATRMRAR